MRVFKKSAALKKYLALKKQEKKQVGFVPTMGALHQGHLKLLNESQASCDVSVVSIFVNPTQFNDKKDLEKYPRTIEKDIQALINYNCDILFYPDTEEIYPPKQNLKTYHLGNLETSFEGRFRPGHFQGVCQVVDKLFSIVEPDKVFFGQKDYQQCLVIKKLINLTPSFQNIDMQIVPTIREDSGLAMSSRNMRLDADAKNTAAEIYRVLQFIKQNIKPGSLETLLKEANEMLTNKGFEVDYVSIANAKTLQPVYNWNGQEQLVAIIAAFLNSVRLIDNLTIN